MSTCGTNAGYVQHIKRRSPTCVECRAAHARYVARWRARRCDRPEFTWLDLREYVTGRRA